MKRAGKEEGKEQGERREKGKKGKEERRPVTSTQTLHCESLVPSTAFQCKHRHPICDRVNWFFDVSRKVLIEGGVGGGRLFLSPQTPVYLFKKKILPDSKELPFVPSSITPPSSKFQPPRCYPRSWLFSGSRWYFFFLGTNFHLLISQLKKKKKNGSAAGSLLPLLIKWNNKGNAC